MVSLTKSYAVKNSIRYDQPNRQEGPLSIYVPKDWLITQGIDPKNAPETIILSVSFDPAFKSVRSST